MESHTSQKRLISKHHVRRNRKQDVMKMNDAGEDVYEMVPSMPSLCAIFIIILPTFTVNDQLQGRTRLILILFAKHNSSSCRLHAIETVQDSPMRVSSTSTLHYVTMLGRPAYHECMLLINLDTFYCLQGPTMVTFNVNGRSIK